MEVKRAKVRMLPTNCIQGENTSSIYTRNTDSKITLGASPLTWNPLFTPQHLYFTTDEEIKKGDWCVFGFNLEDELGKDFKNEQELLSALQCTGFSKEGYLLHSGGSTGKKYCRKIISTTDTKLKVQKHSIWNELQDDIKNNFHPDSLPQPSQSFIEKYCELGGIDEVNVEYEFLLGNEEDEDRNLIPEHYLKIDSHNTITIHPIKDSWNREEVESLIQQHRLYALKFGLEPNDTNKWCSNNIK